LSVARVHGETLSLHLRQLVRIVGQVIDGTSDPVTINTTDGHTVPIRPVRADDTSRFARGAWVEVTGRVQEDNTIIKQFTIPMPGEVNPDAWNQMVALMDRHDEIFL
jgi:hypothetical protein